LYHRTAESEEHVLGLGPHSLDASEVQHERLRQEIASSEVQNDTVDEGSLQGGERQDGLVGDNFTIGSARRGRMGAADTPEEVER